MAKVLKSNLRCKICAVGVLSHFSMLYWYTFDCCTVTELDEFVFVSVTDGVQNLLSAQNTTKFAELVSHCTLSFICRSLHTFRQRACQFNLRAI